MRSDRPTAGMLMARWSGRNSAAMAQVKGRFGGRWIAAPMVAPPDAAAGPVLRTTRIRGGQAVRLTRLPAPLLRLVSTAIGFAGSTGGLSPRDFTIETKALLAAAKSPD